jgi:hypothetical protein
MTGTSQHREQRQVSERLVKAVEREQQAKVVGPNQGQPVPFSCRNETHATVDRRETEGSLRRERPLRAGARLG